MEQLAPGLSRVSGSHRQGLRSPSPGRTSKSTSAPKAAAPNMKDTEDCRRTHQDQLPTGSSTRKPGRRMSQPIFEPTEDEKTAPRENCASTGLGRANKRLSQPEQLKKFHLRRHRMTTDHFRFRARALHLPKETYDLCDKIRTECEVGKDCAFEK